MSLLNDQDDTMLLHVMPDKAVCNNLGLRRMTAY